VNNPNQQRHTGTHGHPDTTPAPGICQRILLVEDHVDTAFLIRIILERSGFTVTVAHNLHDAMTCAAAEPPDLLLSDIMLPDGTGWELLGALKPTFNVKSIAVSALSSRDDMRRSAQAGFDRHITKPVRADLLCATIAEVLQERQSAEGHKGDQFPESSDSLKVN
jgi:two-component system CheB/CheR fusion protein